MQDLPENPDVSGLSPTELFLWQLSAKYAQEYPKPDEPVRSELVAAFVPRLVRLQLLGMLAPEIVSGVSQAAESFPKLQGQISSEIIKRIHDSKRELVAQIVELDSWLHDPGVDEHGLGNWLTAHGYSFEKAVQLIGASKRYQAWRRPIKHRPAVAALDARTMDHKLSWTALAERFCNCGRSSHDEGCSEALRKSVIRLEKVRHKYREAAIPAEELSLVANMFLDRIGWNRGH